MLTFFARLGNWLKKALSVVREIVGDDVIKMALDWARIAAERHLDNTARRDFVVLMLMKRGITDRPDGQYVPKKPDGTSFIKISRDR